MSFVLSLSPQRHVFNDYPYENFGTWRGSLKGAGKQHERRQHQGGSLPSKLAPRKDQSYSSRENKTEPCTGIQPSTQSYMPPPLSDLTTTTNQTSQQRIPCLNESQLLSFQVSSCDGSANFIPSENKNEPPCIPLELCDTSISKDIPFTEDQVRSGFFPNFGETDAIAPISTGSFRRWLSTIRRKGERGPWNTLQIRRVDDGVGDDQVQAHFGEQNASEDEYRYSMSHTSSSDHVHAVRSATMTIAGTSLGTQSLMGNRFPFRGRGTPRSVRTSYESSTCNTDAVFDYQSHTRALQRRKILEELVQSEETYVADLKALVNVYFNLLASISAVSSNTRMSVRRNVTDILHMHESLLVELHKIVPRSETRHNQTDDVFSTYLSGHGRNYSVDATNGRRKRPKIMRKLRSSLDIPFSSQKGSQSSANDPKTTATVARLFESFVGQFFAYQEYGATYDMLVRDIGAAQRSLHIGQDFQSGFEILSRTVESMNARDSHLKKSMTFKDLIIKPFQRICKYPLLFADLCKHTPVVDDPEAHAELEKIIIRLKEAAAEINKAKADPKAQDLIAKTWILQDRLKFSNSSPASVVAHVLGHIQLCGVLHVAYQTNTGLEGQYMLCALFKSNMVLALAEKGHQMFDVVAVIPLGNATIVNTDNGAGLQCHTAPFSWKMVFELNDRLFELILSACSALEEEQWKTHILERSCIESLDSTFTNSSGTSLCPSMKLELKAVGVLGGQPHRLARRKSIQRAATVAAKLPLRHVIIRNTSSPYSSRADLPDIPSCLNRSQSVTSSGYIPILAPRRSERVELEMAMSDIWTKDLLPYPGMKPTENVFKASASHVMRKLSIASITSTLSRRTSSLVNFSKSESKDMTQADSDSTFALNFASNRPLPHNRRKLEPQKSFNVVPSKTVNFHETPERFLPPDFEIKKPSRWKATNQITKPQPPGLGASQNAALPEAKSTAFNFGKKILHENSPRATHTTTKQQNLATERANDANKGMRPRTDRPSPPKENVPCPGRPLARQLFRLFN